MGRDEEPALVAEHIGAPECPASPERLELTPRIVFRGSVK
jgi:hypothetical protein